MGDGVGEHAACSAETRASEVPRGAGACTRPHQHTKRQASRGPAPAPDPRPLSSLTPLSPSSTLPPSSPAAAARTLKQAFTGGLATYVLNPIGSRLPPGSINSNIPGLYSSPATGALPFNTLVARILPQFAPGTPAQLVQNNPFAFIANPNGGPLGQYLLWWGGNSRPISLPTLPTPTGPSGAARYDFNNPATYALRTSGQVNTDQLTYIQIVRPFFVGEREGERGVWGAKRDAAGSHHSLTHPTPPSLSFSFPHTQGGNPAGTATPPV